ncbi:MULTISPECIES: hypothetical protein [unclassified Clostridioides]|uniref:hypothetical protein n=1 Tax=unclassified Clostridioides TaxID=2635829 RepID=UPI001D10EA4A|nr:hypothetical protein [Clostridioides sp. ES-S-0145-01]MCC0709286.1 hypothetical protein [Clostridioides sp. ES-S-0190-01]UDN64006.1 hypothetical protein IC758_20650 [Clostridioides sp. ES-W-0016-02]
MLNRDNTGELLLNKLDLEIFLSDLFFKCKNENELEWLEQTILDYIDLVKDKVIDNYIEK